MFSQRLQDPATLTAADLTPMDPAPLRGALRTAIESRWAGMRSLPANGSLARLSVEWLEEHGATTISGTGYS